MPFDSENNSDQSSTNEGSAQAAADQAAAQASANEQTSDHTSVFLVAGDRAFRSADDVVKNIENAQSHITTLEAERAADREKLAESEAELERLRKITDSLDGRNASGNAGQTDQLSKDEIATQAAVAAVELINQNHTAEEKKANLAAAEAAAQEAYGDQYVAKIKEIAGKHNMTLAAVDKLSETSPSAFKQLFLPAEAGQPHVPSTGSVNLPGGQQEQQPNTDGKNVVKMRERQRISHVTDRMKAAGVEYGK